MTCKLKSLRQYLDARGVHYGDWAQTTRDPEDYARCVAAREAYSDAAARLSRLICQEPGLDQVATTPPLTPEVVDQVESRLRHELNAARREYESYFRLATEQPDPEHIGPLDEAKQRIVGLLSAIKAIGGLR